jgi:hypothetical protein
MHDGAVHPWTWDCRDGTSPMRGCFRARREKPKRLMCARVNWTGKTAPAHFTSTCTHATAHCKARHAPPHSARRVPGSQRSTRGCIRVSACRVSACAWAPAVRPTPPAAALRPQWRTSSCSRRSGSAPRPAARESPGRDLYLSEGRRASRRDVDAAQKPCPRRHTTRKSCAIEASLAEF